MEVRNTTKGDLAMAPGFVVPAGGTLEVEEQDMRRLVNSKVVQAWGEMGWLVADEEIAAADPDQSEDVDADAIAAMDKDALIAFLEGRGIEVDKRLGEDRLREQALEALAPSQE